MLQWNKVRSFDMFYDTNMFICLFSEYTKRMVCVFYSTKNYYLCLYVCVCSSVRMKSENLYVKLSRTHILGILGLPVISWFVMYSKQVGNAMTQR